MNWSEEPRKLTHRGSKVWKQRKADLEELWRQGQNWALEELQQIRQAERVKRQLAYQRFKARRTPEGLRAKWREAKAAHRAAVAAAHAEAEERKREGEKLAARAAELAAEAELERKAREPLVENGNEIEMEILRIPPNPRMVICVYRVGSEERRCLVRVGCNGHFMRGMKLRLIEPSDPSAQSGPWPYTGSAAAAGSLVRAELTRFHSTSKGDATHISHFEFHRTIRATRRSQFECPADPIA
jgi:hypothetical protein